MTIRITESMELPIAVGTIEIDTSNGSVVILMMPCPAHTKDETLTITKISQDHHLVSLYGEPSLGLIITTLLPLVCPSMLKLRGVKLGLRSMKSDGRHWQIIKEE